MSKPAFHYHERSQAVVVALLVHVKALAGPYWQEEPNEFQINQWAVYLHHILNGILSSAHTFGLAPADYKFHGPLTHAQMSAVETLLGLPQVVATGEKEITDEK